MRGRPAPIRARPPQPGEPDATARRCCPSQRDDSHRDLRRVEADATAAGWQSQAVARIMTEDPVTVAPETPVMVAARVLLERKIGCLPVRDGEAIVGIFTTSDALDALLSALE